LLFILQKCPHGFESCEFILLSSSTLKVFSSTLLYNKIHFFVCRYDSYEAGSLSGLCLFVTSTFGNGDPPKMAQSLSAWLEEKLTHRDVMVIISSTCLHKAFTSADPKGINFALFGSACLKVVPKIWWNWPQVSRRVTFSPFKEEIQFFNHESNGYGKQNFLQERFQWKKYKFKCQFLCAVRKKDSHFLELNKLISENQ